ncbi:hypothetical protein HanPI659440_Chr04g0181481 [Helianthus annuus]|nr:hypothetical protein HanPI659440_Chr04g0181481 [Helianthus annuus]
MKHAFSGKGFRMRRDADMAVESDSSFDGSIPSPVYGEVSPHVTEGTVDEDDDMEEFVNSLQGDNETPIDNNHESPLVPNKSALKTNRCQQYFKTFCTTAKKEKRRACSPQCSKPHCE